MTTIRWETRLVILIRQYGPFSEDDLEKAGFDELERRIFKARFNHHCQIKQSRSKVAEGLNFRGGSRLSEKDIERKERNLMDRLEDYLRNRAYWG